MPKISILTDKRTETVLGTKMYFAHVFWATKKHFQGKPHYSSKTLKTCSIGNNIQTLALTLMICLVSEKKWEYKWNWDSMQFPLRTRKRNKITKRTILKQTIKTFLSFPCASSRSEHKSELEQKTSSKLDPPFKQLKLSLKTESRNRRTTVPPFPRQTKTETKNLENR